MQDFNIEEEVKIFATGSKGLNTARSTTRTPKIDLAYNPS